MSEISRSFGPLLEGIIESGCEDTAGCIFYPEVAYVRQTLDEGAERVYFFAGQNDQLNESLDGDALQIVEDFEGLELEERTVNGRTFKWPKNAVTVVEGPYQRSDTKNANQRIYKRTIWERIVGDAKSKAQQSVAARGMVGHLEHPKDGRSDGTKGALLTTNLTLKEDGVVWGRSELLDTPSGLILQEYTKKNVRWGVSSRGKGSVASDGKVNETDFELVTFDAVMNPSTPGAYPKKPGLKDSATTESVDKQSTKTITEDAQTFVDGVQSLIESIEEDHSETDRVAWARKFLKALTQTDSFESSGKLPLADALKIRESLVSTLSTLVEARADDDDAVFEEIFAGLDEDDPKGEVVRVVNSLQSRLSDALDEAETLRNELAETKADVRLSYQARDEAVARLVESESVASSAKRQLSTAQAVIAEQSAIQVADVVGNEIASVIEELPELDSYRDVLEKAQSSDEVRSLAERLIPKLADEQHVRASERVDESTAYVRSPALPYGSVQSEVGGDAKTQLSESTHSGARLAGAAVSKMQTT